MSILSFLRFFKCSCYIYFRLFYNLFSPLWLPPWGFKLQVGNYLMSSFLKRKRNFVHSVIADSKLYQMRCLQSHNTIKRIDNINKNISFVVTFLTSFKSQNIADFTKINYISSYQRQSSNLVSFYSYLNEFLYDIL